MAGGNDAAFRQVPSPLLYLSRKLASKGSHSVVLTKIPSHLRLAASDAVLQLVIKLF